eukprot:CAMPEP_0201477176 /NCGR_PEP_ID=MMETSP0151_2-20130828/2248_1 /ASSEMBLY_ACC=CAM_ASM_000257 /TAXON_ID=200890 /ORGANISM="Paramoeba atlantica, Strain 621/1 / CCAP 1560/9" /LENGTH=479 /DNA_ID=CAMNT_0047857801 /DNA_START=1488 /DNA_END=2927 /DNA_ORIENTATION=+
MSMDASQLRRIFMLFRQEFLPEEEEEEEERKDLIEVTKEEEERKRENDYFQKVEMETLCKPPKPDKNTFTMLQNRRLGPLSSSQRAHLGQRYIPQYGRTIGSFDHHVFCGKYSRDGSTFASACQDSRIRIYDTAKWKLQRTIRARDIGWSIIDVDYSPDGKYLAYSSWSDSIHMVRVDDLKIPDPYHASHNMRPETRRFCLFSIKFSPDNREILGGASDYCLYIYDQETEQRTVKITAHRDDINAVQWADESANVVFSGSDDTFCKVWDRRLLGESEGKPCGVMVGHLDGITHIDSKGDGRYFISNSKDQSIKLWDLRTMQNQTPEGYRPFYDWDYRTGGAPSHLGTRQQKVFKGELKHTNDTSVITFRGGHRVLQTLIRAYFSPKETTGQRYIISGSATGGVCIYDVLTGEVVTTLKQHRQLVRDVACHPHRPEIVSSSWDGTVKLWSTRQVDKEEEERGFSGRSRRLRIYYSDSDED